MEYLHNLITIDAWLEKSLVITFLQINQFLAHHLEIIQKALLAHLVLAGDISLAERHQVVDVIAGIIQQAANGTVGNLLISNHNRTHVEFYQFLHILHLRIHRKFHTAEDTRNHLCTYYIMTVKCPADIVVPALALRFTDVVEESSPAEPEVI